MTAHPQPGSHRDPDSRVWRDGQRVLRAVAPSGAAAAEALLASALLADAVADGRLLAAEAADPAELPDSGAAIVLEHPVVEPWTVPAEWSFSMLRDAALLHLDLTADALAEGLFLKDATPTNITFRGPHPVFVDHGSFTVLGEGEGWRAYDQMLRTFVVPLVLQAHLGVDLHSLLRGAPDGVEPRVAAALLRGRNRLRRDVALHVIVPALAQGRARARADEVGADLGATGTPPEVLAASVARTRRTIAALRWRASDSQWSDYGPRRHYAPADLAEKEAFVRRVAARRHRRLVLDVGANDGRFSRLVAPHADAVVAADRDHLAVDLLHRSLRSGDDRHDRRIVPVVLDLLAPTPATGWRNRGQSSFADRVQPDLVLALAVVHHLCISGTVPPEEIVAWMASLGCTIVVEVPHEDDPMARRLLAAKPDRRWDRYRLEAFEAAFARDLTLVERTPLADGRRVLFHLEPREAAAP